MQSNSVIQRLLDILLLFKEGRELWSIDDIGQQLDLPKSTSYRLVRELQARGFLEKAGSSHYQLGIAFFKLSQVAFNSNRDIRMMAFPSMKRLAETTGESVSLMRLMNRQVVCIENIEGQRPLRVSIGQGYIQPVYSGASSRVLLAHVPEQEWEDYLEFPLQPYTDMTITDFETLQENLRTVRREGYTISNGENEVGARAIAVPVMNKRNEVVAALSIEAPATRMTDEIAARYLDLLVAEARRIRQEYT